MLCVCVGGRWPPYYITIYYAPICVMRITKRQPGETSEGHKVESVDDAASEGASGSSDGASSAGTSAGEVGTSSSSLNILVSKVFFIPVWITQIGKGAIMH